jgi:hypothetical protein
MAWCLVKHRDNFTLRGRKWQDVGEDCIMRSFITCTLHQIRVIRRIKTRRMRLAVHVACMGEMRTACKMLVGKHKGKRPLGRPRRRREDLKEWNVT